MVFHRIHDAVGDMILEDHAAGPGEGRLDRSQLDQDLGTVSAVFYHPLYRFQVADGPAEPIDDRFGLLVAVRMAVCRARIAVIMGMSPAAMLLVKRGKSGRRQRGVIFSMHAVIHHTSVNITVNTIDLSAEVCNVRHWHWPRMETGALVRKERIWYIF